MASGNADPRVTTLLLAVTGVEALVLFGAGVGLVVQPAVIGSIWPWPLTPFNAAFLGAVYSASLVSAAALTVIGRWSPARIVVPMILVFTTIVLIVSLAYLGRFDPGWPPGCGSSSTWRSRSMRPGTPGSTGLCRRPIPSRPLPAFEPSSSSLQPSSAFTDWRC